MFLLYLIPGVPKDTLTYIAGLTPIHPGKFLLLSTIARFPGILGSCYIGANLQSKNYTVVIIVSSIAVLLFVIGMIYQEKIVNYFHHRKDKNDIVK